MKRLLLAYLLSVLMPGIGQVQEKKSDAESATQQLSKLTGIWRLEFDALATTGKGTTVRECRWASQGKAYLVCELVVNAASRSHRQLSIYSYNSHDQNYSVTVITAPGEKPSNSTLTINDNVWIYTSMSTLANKARLTRNVTEHSDTGTEKIRIEMSEDNGRHWTVIGQGTGHKIGE